MVSPVSAWFILGVTSCSASDYVPCERSPGVVVWSRRSWPAIVVILQGD